MTLPFLFAHPAGTPPVLVSKIIEPSGSFSSKSLNISLRLVDPTPRRAEWMIFFKIGCCLSGLGIVRKNRRMPKSYL